MHLVITHFITFLTFTSLIVCVARDPGPVRVPGYPGSKSGGSSGTASAARSPVAESAREEEELSLAEALMGSTGGGVFGEDDVDFSAPGKWCRKCWVSLANHSFYISEFYTVS
jgi:palmitoyltransferase ZDHHC2/15/20